MKRSSFRIDKMDCPCEENIIRMKLQDVGTIEKLEFNIAERSLDVIHTGEIAPIASLLDSLNLGSKLIKSEDEKNPITKDDDGHSPMRKFFVL